MVGTARLTPLYPAGAQTITGPKTFNVAPLINYRPETVDMNDRFYNVQDGDDDVSEKLDDALNAVDGGSGSPLVHRIIFGKPGDYLKQTSNVTERGDIEVSMVPGARFVIDGQNQYCLKFTCETEGEYIQNVHVHDVSFYDPDPVGHTGNTEQSHGIIFKRVDGFRAYRNKFDSMGDESIDTGHSKNGQIFLNKFYNGTASAGGGNGTIGVNTAAYLDVFLNEFFGQIDGQAIRVEIAAVPDPGTVVGHHRIFRNKIHDHNALQPAIAFGQGANGDIEDVLIASNDFYDCGHIPIQLTVLTGHTARAIRVMRNNIQGGGTFAPGSTERGAITALDDRIEGLMICGNTIEGWGTVTNHHGIRCYSGIVNDNVIRDVADTGIRGENGVAGYLAQMNRNIVERAGRIAVGGDGAGWLMGTGWRGRDNMASDCRVGEILQGTGPITTDPDFADCDADRTDNSGGTAIIRTMATLGSDGILSAAERPAVIMNTINTVIQEVDQVFSTVTLEDSDELFFPIGALETHVFEFTLYQRAAATTTGYELNVVGPVGSVVTVAGHGGRSSISVASVRAGDVTDVSHSAFGNPALVTFKGIIVNGATPGNVTLQCRSEVAASGVTIDAGSYLEEHQP